MSYFLKSEIDFDSSHYLEGHSGKCRNLHGHRWKVEYELKSNTLIKRGSSKDMVIDFTDIKNLIAKYFNQFDHALLVDMSNIKSYNNLNFLRACLQMGFKIVQLPCRTTAENMSKLFFYDIDNLIKNNFKGLDIKLNYITVYETPNNSATYKED